MASTMSPLNEVRIWVRFSRSMPACRLPISSWLHITSLVIHTPIGLLAAISPGDAHRRLDHLAVGHDPAHQADAPGLVGVDQPAGEQQLEGGRRADQPGQQPAHADVAAGEADA